MVNVVQKGMEYEIRFPYNQEIIDIVKSVPGRRWVPESKCWTLPLARLGFLIASFKGTKYEHELVIQSAERIDIDESLDPSKSIPNVNISDADLYVEEGSKLFKHQIDSIKYDKYRWENGLRSGFILADQPGTGKTLTVLNIAMYHKKKYGSKHCLIIACVNSAKYNWRDDIIKHSNETIEPYILGSRLRRDGSIRYEGSGKEKFDDLKTMKMYGDENGQDLPYFLIINIEAIGRTKLGKTHIITEQIINLVNSKEIGVIALDEIHRNASMTSEQGKQLMQIKKKIDSGVSVDWIPMTGTPIKSRPTDAFLPLRLVGAHDYTSYYNWCEYFCIKGNFKEIIGYKNIDKLKNMLQPNMLRRLKKDILDLPEKMHNTIYVENTLYQHKLYEKVREGLFSQIGSIKKSVNPLAQLIKLRQVNGSPELVDTETQFTESTYLKCNAKLAELLRLVEEITEDGSKVVVFSNWVEPLRTLYKYMSKQYKVCCYTGTMPNEDRELHKKAFINNPEYKIMLGTVGALGTSHTLTVAHNVIFYDEPWNPCDIEQCEDRCHRPGTSQTVNIYTLITQGTIDETVHEILHKKEGVATFMVDNKLDVKKHPELLNMFLQSSK